MEARLRLVLGWARETLADITLRQQIKTDVEEGMEKTQREFLLRRQLEAIRKELGELDGEAADGSPQGYREQIEARDLPDAVRAALLREVAKLERTSEQSPEQGWPGPGSRRSWKSPGARPPRTTSTSPPPGVCSTRTTTVCRT